MKVVQLHSAKKYMIIRFVYLFVYSSKNILVVAYMYACQKIKLVFCDKSKSYS